MCSRLDNYRSETIIILDENKLNSYRYVEKNNILIFCDVNVRIAFRVYNTSEAKQNEIIPVNVTVVLISI